MSARYHEIRAAERRSAFRAASWARLRAARLYEIGATHLGPLSSEGREDWIGRTSVEPLHLAMSDARAGASAERAAERGMCPTPDGSAWAYSQSIAAAGRL